jgi:uncharacterized membrane protein
MIELLRKLNTIRKLLVIIVEVVVVVAAAPIIIIITIIITIDYYNFFSLYKGWVIAMIDTLLLPS